MSRFLMGCILMHFTRAFLQFAIALPWNAFPTTVWDTETIFFLLFLGISRSFLSSSKQGSVFSSFLAVSIWVTEHLSNWASEYLSTTRRISFVFNLIILSSWHNLSRFQLVNDQKKSRVSSFANCKLKTSEKPVWPEFLGSKSPLKWMDRF